MAAEERAAGAGSPTCWRRPPRAARRGPARRARPAHRRARPRLVGGAGGPRRRRISPTSRRARPRGAGERCAAATRRRDDAVAELDRARRCAGGLDALAGEVTALQVELDERRAEFDQVGELADLVNGRGANTLRMRLQSFVLAARLEQVAEAASRRLQDMSGGRYTFRHSDAQGRQRGAGRARARRPGRVHRLPARRPRRSPAARASWRPWHSRSDWPTSSPRSPAACRSTRCSSTRGSARSTPARSTPS